MVDVTGETISHYEILDKLGGGGMGVVYRARDTRLGRTVALKFLPGLLSTDPEAKKRFMQEARAASSLDHPNICTVHDVGETDSGELYIVMAHYEGQTLKERLSEGPLPVELATNVAFRLARALQRAHEAGIVHRDIKPANIMLTERGEVKLLDFGIAKLVGSVDLTKTGSTVGTAHYMSPEQVRGETLDYRTDLWSLGIVLYEMLAGLKPFTGDYDQAISYSILNESPGSLEEVRPDLPPGLAHVVDRGLSKRIDDRYESARSLAEDLEAFVPGRTAGSSERGRRPLLRTLARPAILVPMVAALAAVGYATYWWLDRQAEVRWARYEALPEIQRLAEVNWRDFTEPYAMAEELERIIPDDPELGALMAAMSLPVSVRTEPSGATVHAQVYTSPGSEWMHLGTTPIDSVRLPLGVFRFRIEKDGFEPILAVASSWDVRVVGDNLIVPYELTRTLDPLDSIPPDMVRVQGWNSPGGRLPDFLIDRFEVTNRQYQQFVDAGGYRSPEFWKNEFGRDASALSWEEAMQRFVDRTGRPGPSNWEAGHFPAGRGDHPVTGVSWYEAAAYAEFVGKVLPTTHHWDRARGVGTPVIDWPQLGGFALFAPFSNFGVEGTVAVGSLQGATVYGAYDMAGNAREWVFNEASFGRVLRGGAAGDHSYSFGTPNPADAFDRSEKNGFRCALMPNADSIPASVFGASEFWMPVDFSRVRPVDDEVFEVFRQRFDYDPADPHGSVEHRDESGADWVYERVSYDAAYGNERIIGHLFLPRNAEPPYQTVIYFPGSAARYQVSSDGISDYYEVPIFLSFLPRSGRAVLFPVYKGTFERNLPDQMAVDRVQMGLEPAGYRYSEYVAQVVKDFRRSIDYLETRDDVASDKLAFYGMSWGASLGSVVTAVEARPRASILLAGGLWDIGRPEVHPKNFLSRVTTPTLMLNGRHDSFFRHETSIRPMYDLLGTPDEDKKLVLFESDHIVPREGFIRETLAWLDTYLGPVN